MNDKLYISWDNIKEDIELFADRLPKVDYIIALSRGGNIPATMLSYKLKTNKIIFISTELYNPTTNELNNTVKIKSNLSKEDISRLNNSKSILIVDDILDSGVTLNAVHEYLINNILNKNIVIHNFTILKKSSALKTFPDIYLKTFSPRVITGEEWIVFPWE
jgi:hypoxanthine phosphoribosyltransferase